MSKLIYGCDPDSDKSGIAVYLSGSLVELQCMSIVSIYKHFETETRYNEYDPVELHIEDLNANNCSSFNHRKKMSQGAKFKVSESVGKCKQVQTEIERLAEHFGIKVVRHKVSKMWKKDKAQFEMITKWKGRSNEDSRSAAYFGFLGVQVTIKGRKLSN